jgi:endonuclease-3 related protein
VKPGPFIRGLHERLLAAWGPQGWWPGGNNGNVVIGAVLTQNTSWKNVERALANLEARGLRDLRALATARRDRLARLIRPVGYFNIKAQRLQSVARWFVEEWACDWDRLRRAPTAGLRQALLGVHGIGQETADSILLYGFDHPVFVVDAYTKRVLVRHGLVGEGARYEEIQALFHRHLPRDAATYNECHALLVRLGNRLCRRVPRCAECPLGEARWFTPAARRSISSGLGRGEEAH